MLLLLFASPWIFAPAHNYTQGDIEEGIRSYRTNCMSCHGADGTLVSGIDLGRGKFRRVSTDEEIVQVIIKGIPGTGMPATAVSPTRAYTIVAFLRTMNDSARRDSIAAASGDPARGKVLFENKGGCARCHRILGQGGRSGPDLSEAGLSLRASEIEKSMLDPDAQYPIGARPIRVVRKDGTAITGLLANQDSFSIQMRDEQGNLLSLQKKRSAGN